ncbi:hypothetical protein LTS15_005132 [Exophiala xenobiotica]|nr:hypothetical protein LTS15_005132 [Exophiala xenobiotica]
MANAKPIPDEVLQGCRAYSPALLPSYGYKPSLAAGITYCVLFSLALAAHCLYSVLNRRWANYLLATGALGELIGWAGRTWSSQCPYNQHAFLMQIVTLVISPVFFTAALFVMLAQLSIQRGAHYSLIPPRLYLYIFCTCDVIALLIQAAGAAIASHEFDTQGDPEKGTHVVVAGLGFQLAAMTVFFACFLGFIARSFRQTWPRHEVVLVGSMLLSFVSLYIRCVYRTVQLAEGWLGYLSTHERFFLALDAALMVGPCYDPNTVLELVRELSLLGGVPRCLVDFGGIAALTLKITTPIPVHQRQMLIWRRTHQGMARQVEPVSYLTDAAIGVHAKVGEGGICNGGVSEIREDMEFV